jgi:hypothetical protein
LFCLVSKAIQSYSNQIGKILHIILNLFNKTRLAVSNTTVKI